jgi:hypothetical protein
LPEAAHQRVVATDWDVIDGDASTATSRRTSMFAGKSIHVDAKVDSRATADPVSYLRALAVEWATKALEDDLAANVARPYAGVNDAIRTELHKYSFMVDSYGEVTLVRELARVPDLRIVADPIMGKRSFYSLRSEFGPRVGWKDEILSFPIGDIETARAIRDVIVKRHCPEHDPYFGNDWQDTSLSIDDISHQRVEALAGHESPSRLLVSALAGLSGRMVDVGVVAAGDLPVASEQNIHELLTTLESAASFDQASYRELLEAEAWPHDFDPLLLARVKANAILGLALEQGLPLFDGHTPGAKAPRG